MKKKTLWQKREDKMKKAKQKAMDIVKNLQSQGFEFNKTYLDTLEKKTPFKRSSKKQYDEFLKTMRTTAIKKQARKVETFEEPGESIKKIYTGTANQSEKTRTKILAKELLKDAKRGIQEGKYKRSQAENMSRLIRNMENQTGIQLTKGQRMSDIRKNLLETLNEIDPEKFGEAASEYNKKQPSGYGFELDAGAMYALGITREGIKARNKEIIEKAKATFQSNRGSWDSQGNFTAKYSDRTLVKLYDFFKTDTWQKYRNAKAGKYDPEQVDALADEIQKSGGVDLNLMVNLLESTNDMDKAMEQYKSILDNE